MGTLPLFATAQLALALRAATGPDGGDAREEACGLLLGCPGGIHLAPARNVSPSTGDSFEIDPAALIAAHRAARGSGPAVLGCWHTHPSGDPAPSRRDARDAAPDGALWLIATARDARLWRAGPAGAVHGRFDPVRFAVRAAGDGAARVVNDALAVQHRGAGREILVLTGRGSVS